MTNVLLDQTSQLFPVSRTLRNPFVANERQVLNQVFNDCLQRITPAKPAHLSEIFSGVKRIGESIKKRMQRKSAEEFGPIVNTVDSFYVLYVLSSGIVDDAKAIVNLISDPAWSELPVQVHVISLQSTYKTRDLKTQFLRVNSENSFWPQFNLHCYDDMQFFYQTDGYGMDRLKNDAVIKTVRDIESYLFTNRLDLNSYKHNKKNGNTTQSQLYIMEFIDRKFEKLKDQIYKLGISPD